MSWLGRVTASGPSNAASSSGLSASDIEFKVPTIKRPTQQSDDEDEDAQPSDDEEEEDLGLPSDFVPAFPALNSAQRSNGRVVPSLAAPSINTEAQPEKVKARRKKVALQPGFSQLDWFNLKQSGADLRVSIDLTNMGERKRLHGLIT